MNAEIEKIFKNFKVDDQVIPVEFLRYKGKSETYITYSSTGENPALSEDDHCIQSLYYYDFDIYTKGSYSKILSKIKKLMIENDWCWEGDSPDLEETDTGYLHKTTSFYKEKGV